MLYIGLFVVDGEEKEWFVPKLEKETLEQAVSFHVSILKRTYKEVQVVNVWKA